MQQISDYWQKYCKVVWAGVTVLGFVAMVTLSLWRAELPRTHDMEFHAARVTNYYLAAKQGQVPPRWAPNLNYGFGYPLFEFMYPLPYAVAAVLYAGVGSVEVALNGLVIGALLMGTLGMLVLGRVLTRNWLASVVAAVMYLTAPYSLLNVFVRGAIGEVAFFGVMPWVMILAVWTWRRVEVGSVTNNWERLGWLILAVPTLIAWSLAHHLSLFVAVVVVVAWLAWQWWWQPVRVVRVITTFWPELVVGFGSVLMTSFFWVPLLLEKHLTQIDQHNTVADFWMHFPEVRRLVWSNWAYGGFTQGVENELFTMMVGVSQWLVLVVAAGSVWYWWSKVSSKRRLSQVVFWLAVAVVSIGLMTPLSRGVWEIVSPLKFMQFPWRLLWVTVFASSMVWLELVAARIVNYRWTQGLASVLLLLGILQAVWWAVPAGYFRETDHNWRNFGPTASAYGELLPAGFDSHKNLKLTERVVIRPQGAKIFDTEQQEQPHLVGQVDITSWTGTRMAYRVEVPVEQAEIVHKTAYFPGWEVWVDGQAVAIDSQDKEFPGRIVFPIEQGSHEVTVAYTQQSGPKQWGDGLTLLGFGLVLFAGGYSIVKLFSTKA